MEPMASPLHLLYEQIQTLGWAVRCPGEVADEDFGPPQSISEGRLTLPVDQFFGGSSADVRTAAAKDAFQARRVQLSLQCRCEPGARHDGEHDPSRKPILLRDNQILHSGFFRTGILWSRKTRLLICPIKKG